MQAFGKIPIDMKKNNINLLSISGHKLYCCKGIGALATNFPTTSNAPTSEKKIDPLEFIQPLFYGGSHELSLRPSTENVPGIVALGKATNIALKILDESAVKIGSLRDYLINKILKAIPNSHLNGSLEKRLYNNCNIRFDGIDGFDLMLKLDANGIACSTGSACSSKSTKPSRILTAIGLSDKEANGSIRLTLGKYTTKFQLNYVFDKIFLSVRQLRAVNGM